MASSILNSDDGVISGTSGIKAVGGDDGVLVFQSKGTETARITTDNYLRLASGGIQFNGDTAAANALDDYEEGTWTPTITGGYTSITYTSQTGWYRKVGSLVIFGGRIQFSGTANSSSVLASAPFTMGAAGYGGGGIPYSSVAVITNTDPYILQNTSEIRFYTKGTGTQIASSGNVSGGFISFVVSTYV